MEVAGTHSTERPRRVAHLLHFVEHRAQPIPAAVRCHGADHTPTCERQAAHQTSAAVGSRPRVASKWHHECGNRGTVAVKRRRWYLLQMRQYEALTRCVRGASHRVRSTSWSAHANSMCLLVACSRRPCPCVVVLTTRSEAMGLVHQMQRRTAVAIAHKVDMPRRACSPLQLVAPTLYRSRNR